MRKRNNIPENDPDRLLARKYGDVLDGREEQADIQDPLFEVLDQGKKQADLEEESITVDGQNQTWQQIENVIQQRQSEQVPVYEILPFPQKWYWAAAAIILAGFTSLLLIWQAGQSDMKMIAEAGTSITSIELKDGSNVTLRPHSNLYQITITDAEHIYAVSGEALFEVALHADRTFIVEAGPGRAVVTGTRFNVSDRDNRASIHLIEGEVIFETLDKSQSLHLTEGEAAVIDRNNRLLEPFSFKPDEAIGWTKHRLTFRDRQAEFVISELEFHFDITIRTPDDIEELTLGGSIPLHDAQQALNDLAIVLEGRFEEIDEGTYQFIPEK